MTETDTLWLWVLVIPPLLSSLVSVATIFLVLRHARRVRKHLALMDLKRNAIAGDHAEGRVGARETAERYLALSAEISEAYLIKMF
jgi:hypothetical protein